MLFSKYLNKYYRKYWYFYLIGILALVFVDYIQLFIPEFLGELVKIFEDAAGAGIFTSQDRDNIVRIVLFTILIGAGLMIGRMLWRSLYLERVSKSKQN